MSRIKERYDQTGSTREAVAGGVASTARIITGAALIIIVVFSGFARGQLVMFQQMGFGVAVALLLDATLIRIVVLPSALASSTGAAGTCPAGSSGCPTSTSRHPTPGPPSIPDLRDGAAPDALAGGDRLAESSRVRADRAGSCWPGPPAWTGPG